MKNTKRKTISFVLTVLTIVAGIITVLASISLYYEMPMNATIEKASLEMYVDGLEWTNGTDMAWGTLAPGGTYNKTLAIFNPETTNLQVSISTSGLPEGWSMTYSENGTIVHAGTWLNGTMQLTTSSLATEASYYWVAHIRASD